MNRSGRKNGVRNLLSKAGSPAVSLGVALSLGAWFIALTTTGAVPSGWQVFDLASFRILSILFFLNVLAGFADAVLKKSRLHLILCLAAAFFLLAAGYCYLFRFEGALSLAEGENYEPFPTSFSSGQKGALAPFPPLAFTLTRVEPDGKTGTAVIVQRGVGTEIGTDWQPVGDSEIRFVKAAKAPLVMVTSKDKGELERSYVKVDVTAGQEASFMFDTLPYEFFLRKDRVKGSEKEEMHLNVRRGKLSLFDGKVKLGQKVPVQAVEVAIEDERKFAMLEIRTRRGFSVLQAAAALLALVGLGAVAMNIKGDRGNHSKIKKRPIHLHEG